MKTIGLIGGTSWYSTIDYYRIINETVNQRSGNNSAAKIILYSLNYGEIIALTEKGDWNGIAAVLCGAAKILEAAGADCLLLCANTMHINTAQVQEAVKIPLIHVADITVKAIEGQSLTSVLLLGTKYTMSADFYPRRLHAQNINVLIPAEYEMSLINTIIYKELGKGIFMPERKEIFINIIQQYISKGAQGVILGCTEIPLLLKQEDCTVPLFDTTKLHALAAVDFCGWQ